MRSIGRAWRVGVAALMLVGLMPGATGAQSVDCADPDLDRIEAEMAVARAAVTANAVALRAAIDCARAQLDAIAVACWDADASGPSLPPIDLSGSGTIGGRSITFPADLVVVEDGPAPDRPGRSALGRVDRRQFGRVRRAPGQPA